MKLDAVEKIDHLRPVDAFLLDFRFKNEIFLKKHQEKRLKHYYLRMNVTSQDYIDRYLCNLGLLS